MCWQMAAQMGAQAGMQAVGDNNNAIATNEAMRKASWEKVRTMNFEDANLRLQQLGLKDQAFDQKTQLNMQRIQSMGSINAAIGEGLAQGNSMERVSRNADAEYIRAAARVDENYRRDYASLFGQQVSNVEETKRQIEDANNNEQEVKSPLEIALDPLNLGIGKVLMKGVSKVPGGKNLNTTYNRGLSMNKVKSY